MFSGSFEEAWEMSKQGKLFVAAYAGGKSNIQVVRAEIIGVDTSSPDGEKKVVLSLPSPAG